MSPILLAVALLAQAETAETSDVRCGAYCLYVSLKALDVPVTSFEELEQRLGPPSAQGYSLGQLAEVAESYGVQTLGVNTSADGLGRRMGRFACIAHLDGSHFVNLVSIEEGKVRVIDPPRTFEAPVQTFALRWKGDALLLSREPLLKEEDLPRPFSLPVSGNRGLWLIVVAAVAVAAWLLMRRRKGATS